MHVHSLWNDGSYRIYFHSGLRPPQMQAISSVWASHGTARMAAMTAMIKTAHGFLIIPQTKRQLDQIHHTFDLQTTHSEQRTVVVVGKGRR